MDKRSAAGSRPWMDHDACRLFKDREILIFEVDLERELLSSQWSRLERAEIQLNRFPAADLISGFFLAALDTDGTRTVQKLDLRPGQLFQALG